MFKIKNTLFCHNCGKTNHKYSNCNEPITSYGVICYLQNKIVLVRRKYTFAFIDFMMGKYDINDVQYISLLFSRMTIDEINNIITSMDFNNLRENIGLTYNTRSHKQEYDSSNIKFTYIKNMGIINECISIINTIFNTNFSSDTLIENNGFNVNKETINKIKKKITNTEIYKYPEWEIPKGKRNDRENNITTAIREFVEETNQDNITVFKNIIPLEEEYTAINNIKYKHIYYLGKMKDYDVEKNYSLFEDKIIEIDEGNANEDQKREISAVGIININNIEKYLRNYQIEKKKVIYKSYQIFNNYNQYFY